nr:TonB-dependent receptor [Bacteroidota bacterium]
RTLRVIRYRTNVSDSRNIGLESYGEMDIIGVLTKGKSKTNLNIFSNFTIQDAKYINSSEAAYQNKQVENVPSMILKTGVNLKRKKFKIGYQYSYNSEQFSDATNASYSPNAIVGIIPAYWVMDLSASYEYKKWTFETGINNLTDNRYFTRRAVGYPGPGIIPADPINFYGAVQLHF